MAASSQSGAAADIIWLALPLLWLGSGFWYSDPTNAGVWYASNQIPAYDLATLPWHFYLSALPEALTWPVVVGGFAGLAWGTWRRQGAVMYAAASILVVVGWHTQYDYKEVRLVSSIYPLVAIGFGLACAALRARFQRLGAVAVLSLLAAAAALSYPTVTQSFRNRITPGEPSFLEAMAQVRHVLPAEAVLAAENVPQVAWYADRRVLRLPAKVAGLAAIRNQLDWIVLTNFERGQPEYAFQLLQRITPTDRLSRDLMAFHDSRFVTVLVRPEWAMQRLR